MASWTNTTAGLQRAPWRAVVRPARLERAIVRTVLPAGGMLAPWVEHVWSLAWTEPVPPDLSAVITHPTLHLTVESGPQRGTAGPRGPHDRFRGGSGGAGGDVGPRVAAPVS